MKFLTALIAGLLFGAGLLVSGMTEPRQRTRVSRHLWRVAAAARIVMGAAVLTAAPSFWFVRHNRRSLLGAPVDLPDRRRIDKLLLAGAAIFGVGWGLAAFARDPASYCSPAAKEWRTCSWRR